MKICFVTETQINDFFDNAKDISAEIIIFSFRGMGIVDYKSELDGKSGYFEDLALMSKEYDCVIISGCETDTYGVLRLSAVIADKGKILGVSDMVHVIDGEAYECGSGFRVYDTSVGKIGLVVGSDLFFPESARVLALCDSDLIVSIFKNLTDTTPQIMMRSGSFANGVAFAMCANGYAQISGVCGKMLFASPLPVCEYSLEVIKDYHLIESRQRGRYREFNNSY